MPSLTEDSAELSLNSFIFLLSAIGASRKSLSQGKMLRNKNLNSCRTVCVRASIESEAGVHLIVFRAVFVSTEFVFDPIHSEQISVTRTSFEYCPDGLNYHVFPVDRVTNLCEDHIAVDENFPHALYRLFQAGSILKNIAFLPEILLIGKASCEVSRPFTTDVWGKQWIENHVLNKMAMLPEQARSKCPKALEVHVCRPVRHGREARNLTKPSFIESHPRAYLP